MPASPARNDHEARLVRLGQAIAHPLRVRVLNLLLQGEAFRVGVLARRFHVALPLMKQHLQRLCAAGLVAGERRGDAVWYRLADADDVAPLRPLLAPESAAARSAADES